MNEESSPSLPGALQPVMDTVIELKDLRADADQPKLQTALASLAGVESVDFGEHSVTVRYDPEKVNKAKLCEAITRAGFHVAAAESAPASPPIEPRNQPLEQQPEEAP